MKRLVAALACCLAVGCGTAADDLPGKSPGGGGVGATNASGSGAAGGAGGGSGGAGGAASDDVLRWVEEVTLGPEFGGQGEVVSRFASAPSLSVMEGAFVDQPDLGDTIDELDAVLPTAIDVRPDGDATAQVEVYFTDLAAFDAIATAHGFPYVPGNWGYFYMFWDASNTIEKAYVLIATDVLAGSDLRHFVHEEVTQSLGASNDSAIFADSVFYANSDDGGDAQQLSTLDRRLVGFLYSDVAPGATKAQLDAAFASGW